jgi:hypothetical protein
MSDKHLSAWHEAGHILSACNFGVRIKKAYISESGHGTTVIEDPGLGSLLAMEIYGGGMAGAKVYLETKGRFTGLSSRYTMYHWLTTHPGMCAGAERDIEQIHTIMRSENKHVSDEDIYRHAEKQAELIMILDKDYSRLKRFAEALLKNGHLNGEQIAYLWDYVPPAKQLGDALVNTLDKGPDLLHMVQFVVFFVVCPLIVFLGDWLSLPKSVIGYAALVSAAGCFILGMIGLLRARYYPKTDMVQTLLALLAALFFFLVALNNLTGHKTL